MFHVKAVLPGAALSLPGVGVLVEWISDAVNADGTEPRRRRGAFFWHEGTGVTNMGIIEGTQCDPLPTGISDDGEIIVGSCSNQAFGWTRAGGMVELPMLSDNDRNSSAADITGDGRVIVGSSGDAAVRRIDGLPQALSGFDEWNRYHINSVSDDGAWIVGAGSMSEDLLHVNAFLWHQALGPVLIPVPEDYGYVLPEAISAPSAPPARRWSTSPMSPRFRSGGNPVSGTGYRAPPALVQRA